MRPSPASLSKASRLPLNSKKGNKNFYKGTGTGNILQRKRIALVNRNTGEQLYDEETGRPRVWNKQVHSRLDESRMVSFVVPPGLADTKMRPYVFAGPEDEGGVARPTPGYPNAPFGLSLSSSLPSSSSTQKKPNKASKPATGGMDANFYINILDSVLHRRATRTEVEDDVQRARVGGKKSGSSGGGFSSFFGGGSKA